MLEEREQDEEESMLEEAGGPLSINKLEVSDLYKILKI